MAEHRALRICIVTADIVGPIRNGGIGTWYHALALALAEDGHHVTILYTLGDYCENQTLGHWKHYYAEKRINFVPHPKYEKAICDAALWVRISFEVCEWLRDREAAGTGFDVVHFHEWRGHGFYPTLAKRQGLAFANTVLCVGTHSPLLWHKFGSAEFIGELEELQTDFLERQSVELCDLIVSPSHYMVEWITSQGWVLPRRVDIRQYIQSHFVPSEQASYEHRQVNEIVFFGRLETRKGIALFCDAMDEIGRNMPAQSFTVTFLGKRSQINGVDSKAYLEHRCGGWPFAWKIVDTLDHAGAIEFLRQPGRMAVIASLLENSPNTVLECLVNQVPCLCTKIGGNAELIAEADRERITFDPREKVLEARLRTALERGFTPGRPAILPEETKSQWLAWHQEICAEIEHPQPRGSDEPLVSVCLVHRNRPNLLRQAVESLRKQDYQRVETVLVDDGSNAPEAIAYLDELEADFAKRGWKIVRQANAYLGAARNRAAREASGEFLLFMDDDNIAKPDEVSTFVRAARYSGADVLTSVLDTCHGEAEPEPGNPSTHRWLPIGAAPSVGIFTNLIGDANALFRKSSFEALGGFTEDYGIGHEDWELFTKAILRGYVVQVVPQALFWYRVGAASMLRVTSKFGNHMRSLRPYLEAFPKIRTAIEYSQSIFMLLAQRTADASTLYDRVMARDAEIQRESARSAQLEQRVEELSVNSGQARAKLATLLQEADEYRASIKVLEQRLAEAQAQSESHELAWSNLLNQRDSQLGEAQKRIDEISAARRAADAAHDAQQNDAQAKIASADENISQITSQNEELSRRLADHLKIHGNGDLASYQKRVDEHWHSLSWRASKPLRAMVAGDAPPSDEPPKVQSRMEAEQIIDAIRSSASWEALGIFRAVGRLLKHHRRD